MRYHAAMQRVTLVAVGKIRSTWISAGCSDYIRRLHATTSLVIFELPPSKSPDPARQRDDESGRILEAARKLKGTLLVLDETGKSMTSKQFAAAMNDARDKGEHLVFLLGGAYGFNDTVRKAGGCLKLSDMTLPHELARVCFLEQLYRAGEINKGSGYHH